MRWAMTKHQRGKIQWKDYRLMRLEIGIDVGIGIREERKRRGMVGVGEGRGWEGRGGEGRFGFWDERYQSGRALYSSGFLLFLLVLYLRVSSSPLSFLEIIRDSMRRSLCGSRTHGEWTLQTEDFREIGSRFCFIKTARAKQKTKQKNETQTQIKRSAEGADGSQGDVTLSIHLSPVCFKYKTQTLVTLQ